MPVQHFRYWYSAPVLHVMVQYVLSTYILLVNQSFIPMCPYFPASTDIAVCYVQSSYSIS